MAVAISRLNRAAAEPLRNTSTFSVSSNRRIKRSQPVTTCSSSKHQVTVSRPDDEKESKALHGLTRTLIANMVEGVTNGYRKTLEISGVGYRAGRVANRLTLQVGFSHPVEIAPPPGIAFEVETPTRFHVTGIDKALVGEIAAQVRRIRPPEPYLGKGIRYAGERIRRKAGKAGKVGAKR